MNIHIHIGPTDLDLLRLYKYLPYGLGKVFKNVVLSYYKNETYKIPELKYRDKGTINDVKVYFTNKELEIIRPLLEKKNKSSIIKNLVRMQFGRQLMDFCRPVYNAKAKRPETKSEVKIKPEIKQEAKLEQNSQPKMKFKPQEF